MTFQLPAIRHAASVDLSEAFAALKNAEGPGDVAAAERLYYAAQAALEDGPGEANATERYGIFCGLAACRLMSNDFEAAWDLLSRAIELEPTGAEALAIRASLYKEEQRTGLRAIPARDRRVMDQEVQQDPDA